MKFERKQVLVLTGLAFLVPAIWFATRPPSAPNPNAALFSTAAKNIGVSEADYMRVARVGDKMGRDGKLLQPLTRADLDDIKWGLQQPNESLRGDALLFLAGFRDPAFQPEARELSRSFLTHANPWFRVWAVANLRDLDDPSWKTVAQSMLSDGDATVRENVKTLVASK
jgi:hypothetical protein